MRFITMTPYDDRWIAKYEEEASAISRIFGGEIIAIHHIGSTAVPGLQAKPTIDIMPVVKNIQHVDVFNDMMIDLGYKPKGENGIEGRRYFQKGDSRRTHHVHIYEVGSPHVERHLVFRDYLRSHPEDARRYGVLKQELAMKFPYDSVLYVQGKEVVGRELESRAMEWRKNVAKEQDD